MHGLLLALAAFAPLHGSALTALHHLGLTIFTLGSMSSGGGGSGSWGSGGFTLLGSNNLLGGHLGYVCLGVCVGSSTTSSSRG